MVRPISCVAIATLWLCHIFVTTRGLVHHYVPLYVQQPPAHGRHQQTTSLSTPDHFGYSRENGPNVWPLKYPQCNGSRQSPIDLELDQTHRLVVKDRLQWHGYQDQPQNLTLTNNGHTVQLSGNWELTPSISGGPLKSDYTFSQLHFHWGSNDKFGSEHTVGNVSFPMEMHLVHYKKAYGSQDEALKYEDGLAVVSILYQLSKWPNPGLDAIIPFLDAVAGAELKVTLMRPFPLEILHVSFDSDYFTYPGSLTTPPCSEAVTWIVSSRPLTLSHEQLAKFRQLSSEDDELENNFRPVQPTNGRPVFYVY